MKNFDIIKDIDGLRTIYRYCATAEDFQVANQWSLSHARHDLHWKRW